MIKNLRHRRVIKMKNKLFVFVLMTLLVLSSTGLLFAIEKPVLEKYVQPEYPLHLLKRDIEGKTIIQLDIERSGKVISAEIKESSCFESFDIAALKAASKWKFKKMEKKMTVNIPITFKIE
jgi:TonB family protein